MAKRTIITIGREYGSGGREIGSRLAQEMGLAYYDKELLVLAAKESGIAQELFEHNDEMLVNSLLYSLSVHPYSAGSLAGMQNMPLTQKMFLALFEVIQKIARQEDCVIVGRCADYALRSYPDCLNVFIHAPLPYRGSANAMDWIRPRQRSASSRPTKSGLPTITPTLTVSGGACKATISRLTVACSG